MSSPVIQEIIHYIRQNFSEELPLEKLAKRAFLSPFHFQRVFKEAIGESPKQYISRVRLEAAAHQIVLDPEASMLQVAMDCGYNSLEAFSRAFKNYYSISPDNFRKMPETKKMDVIRETTHRAATNDIPSMVTAVEEDDSLEEISIEVVRLPPRKMIFLPTTLESPEKIIEALTKVKQWAEIRELSGPESRSFGLFMDYPLFTALDKCRYLACYSLPEKPELSGDIQYMELPARAYAAYEIKGGIDEMIRQTTLFWKYWLPKSGYKMLHEPAPHIPKQEIGSLPFNENTYQIHIALEPT